MEVLPDVDLELPAVEPDRDRRVAAAQDVGDGGAAGAGARGGGLPRPALEDPRADDARLELGEPRDVRAVREQRARARSPGRSRPRSSASSSSRSATAIAHCGLPIDDVLEAPLAPGSARRRRRPAGYCFERSRARPMSTRQLVADRIVGRISPATVWIENWSRSVQPRWRRYRIASRAPLPLSSASEPSGLKIRSRATKPGSSGGGAAARRRRRRRCGGRTAPARAGVSGRRSAARR